MRLSSALVEVAGLTQTDRDAMFALMQQCFANVNRKKFEEDLQAKWKVIQVRDPVSGRLVGFSTQVVLQTKVNHAPVSALFSGDTVVDPCHWGDPALAHKWGQFALRLIDQHAAGTLFWFLTTKGFRTYRYLPLFFRDFFPQRAQSPSADQLAVIDAFGQLVGHQRYDRSARIIRTAPSNDFVRRGISEPGLRFHNDPHVRFFVEQNPHYARGDELCCLAPLSRENFTRAAYRVIHARTRHEEALGLKP